MDSPAVPSEAGLDPTVEFWAVSLVLTLDTSVGSVAATGEATRALLVVLLAVTMALILASLVDSAADSMVVIPATSVDL